MADLVNIGRNAENVETSPQMNGYSGVRIYVGTDDENNSVEYTAGDLSGNVLEITNPFGTQQMARNILNGIRGYQYQPMDATGTLLNPAAEMGDGVSVNGVYTGMYIRATDFGTLMKSNIGAPTNQEIEHEFAVESATDRQYTRFVRDTKAMLRITNLAIEAEAEARQEDGEEFRSQLGIQATEIAARVTKTGSNGSNTFGWSLDSDGFYINNGTIKKNGTDLFTFTRSGLSIKGEIKATSGTIGGFTIGTNAIYNNISTYGGSQSTGVYLGTNGIQLGQGFKVNTAGEIRATKGTIGGFTIGTNAIYNNISTYGGSQSTGVYLGTNGIQLGQNFKVNTSGNVTAKNMTLTGGSITLGDNFRVTSSGNVTAKNMTLTGNLTVGGQPITAEALRSGALSAYNNSSYWSSGSGYGYNYNAATQSGTGSYPGFFRCGTLQCTSLFLGGVGFAYCSTININGVDRRVVCW